MGGLRHPAATAPGPLATLPASYSSDWPQQHAHQGSEAIALGKGAGVFSETVQWCAPLKRQTACVNPSDALTLPVCTPTTAPHYSVCKGSLLTV